MANRVRPRYTRSTRKCHCAMCGVDNAGKASTRRTYRAMGIPCDEYGDHGAAKRAARKLRRVREYRTWTQEEAR